MTNATTQLWLYVSKSKTSQIKFLIVLCCIKSKKKKIIPRPSGWNVSTVYIISVLEAPRRSFVRLSLFPPLFYCVNVVDASLRNIYPHLHVRKRGRNFSPHEKESRRQMWKRQAITSSPFLLSFELRLIFLSPHAVPLQTRITKPYFHLLCDDESGEDLQKKLKMKKKRK